MIRTIAARTTGLPLDVPVLRAAARLARGLGAHLLVVHVHIDPQDVILDLSAADPMNGSNIDELLETMVRSADESQAAAKRYLDDLDPTLTPPEWLVLIGREPDRLTAYGRAADLIVMGRPGEDKRVPLELIEPVLLRTGKPLLLLPPEPPASLLDTIVIAWKGTAEAARAIVAALPLIEAAGRVIVMTVAEREGPSPPELDLLLTTLQRHNAKTEWIDLPVPATAPVHALLAEAARQDATLLVVGAYSHSRVRETVFGGFTHTILREAPLPVLLTH